MLISVITPTYNWHDKLHYLYRWFRQQSYPDKELLVYDDSAEATDYFAGLDDPRVRYFHSPERKTIGEKRNRLVAEARGEWIAHFDHDDYYAPAYLQFMMDHVGDADLLTLDGWFAYHVDSRAFFYWQTSKVLPVHWVAAGKGMRPAPTAALENKDDWVRRNLYGYGFSYLYRKRLVEKARFPHTQAQNEDYLFFEALLQTAPRVETVDDTRGLLLHLVHAGGLSTVVPNYLLPPFLFETLFGSEVGAYLAGAFGVPHRCPVRRLTT